jgi:SMC interacting uncharacterized protein involved in chromosome segregation
MKDYIEGQIKELGERLKWRLHNMQQDLEEEKEDTTALKTSKSQLHGDMEKLVSELSVQRDFIKTKDDQITNLQKQLDQNNEICLGEYQEALVGPPFRKFL